MDGQSVLVKEDPGSLDTWCRKIGYRDVDMQAQGRVVLIVVNIQLKSTINITVHSINTVLRITTRSTHLKKEA